MNGQTGLMLQRRTSLDIPVEFLTRQRKSATSTPLSRPSLRNNIPNSHQSHLRLKKPLNPNVPAEARRRVHRRAVRLRKPLNPKVPVGARRRVHRKAVRHRKPLNPKALAEAHLQVHRGAVRLKKPLHPKALVEVHRRVVVIRGSAEQNRRQLAARLKKRHSLRVLVGAGPDVES